MRHKQSWGNASSTLSIALLLLVCGGCGLDGPQSTLQVSGPVARMQADIFVITLMVCLAIFLATGGLLLFAIWRFRARPGQQSVLLPQSHGNPKFEFMLMGIVVLLLVIIALPNIQALFAASAPPAGEDVLQIKVTGHQWWWGFEYPDLGVSTANELHIPVDRAVQARLQSADVIHSFWVPKLAGKMDLIPNQDNQMWFKAEATGVYFGQCAELCGASHAHMRLRVVVESAEQFARWVEAQKQPPRTNADPLVLDGSQRFLQKGCIACHAITGTAAQGVAGPNLTRFGSRQTLAAGVLPNTPDNLARWLQNPQAVKPASLMPNLGLNEADIAALSAYLHSLK